MLIKVIIITTNLNLWGVVDGGGIVSLGDDVLEPISLELGMTPMNERMHAYHYNHVLTNSPTKRWSPQSQSARSDVGVQYLRK